MFLRIKIFNVIACCVGLAFPCFGQVNSVLATGDWYKFSVSNDGVFRINYDLLKKIGLNPDQIDPRNIRVYTGSTGMLPQANSKPRIQDLSEIAISVSGEADGKFNTSDYILFFGQGPDRYNYNSTKQIFEYENNLFTDKNFYFLTISSTTGKRMTTTDNLAGIFPVVKEFNDFAFYETEKYNLLKSGRQWFGEQFDNTTEATIRFDIAGIIDNTLMKFTSHVMAQSISDCSFKISFNNSVILDQPIVAIPNSQYGIKGRIVIDTISVNTTVVKSSTQTFQDIKYQFTKGLTPGISIGYLDYFLFTFNRLLAQYGNQTIFTSDRSLSNPISTFEVVSTNSKTMIWDVTNPLSASFQSFQLSVDKINFSTATNALKKFILFKYARSIA